MFLGVINETYNKTDYLEMELENSLLFFKSLDVVQESGINIILESSWDNIKAKIKEIWDKFIGFWKNLFNKIKRIFSKNNSSDIKSNDEMKKNIENNINVIEKNKEEIKDIINNSNQDNKSDEKLKKAKTEVDEIENRIKQMQENDDNQKSEIEKLNKEKEELENKLNKEQENSKPIDLSKITYKSFTKEAYDILSNYNGIIDFDYWTDNLDKILSQEEIEDKKNRYEKIKEEQKETFESIEKFCNIEVVYEKNLSDFGYLNADKLNADELLRYLRNGLSVGCNLAHMYGEKYGSQDASKLNKDIDELNGRISKLENMKSGNGSSEMSKEQIDLYLEITRYTINFAHVWSKFVYKVSKASHDILEHNEKQTELIKSKLRIEK